MGFHRNSLGYHSHRYSSSYLGDVHEAWKWADPTITPDHLENPTAATTLRTLLPSPVTHLEDPAAADHLECTDADHLEDPTTTPYHLEDPTAITNPEDPMDLDPRAPTAGNTSSGAERIEHPLRLLLSEHGASIMAMLGRQDQGILRLREVTSTMRLGAAFAYDRACPNLDRRCLKILPKRKPTVDFLRPQRKPEFPGPHFTLVSKTVQCTALVRLKRYMNCGSYVVDHLGESLIGYWLLEG